jgi:hypothetical protein
LENVTNRHRACADEHAALPCRSLCQKGFEVFLHNSIKERIFGCAALVFDGDDLSRDRDGEEPSRRAIRVPCAGEIRGSARAGDRRVNHSGLLVLHLNKPATRQPH